MPLLLDPNLAVENAILVLNCDDLAALFSSCKSPIASAASLTTSRLLILLISSAFNVHHRTECWHTVQSALVFTYVESARVTQAMDKPLTRVDVLLLGTESSNNYHNIGQRILAQGPWNKLFRVQGGGIIVP